MANIKSVSIKKTKYGTYSLSFTNPDGRRRRLSIGKDYQQAQRLAVRFNDWLLDGMDPESELERNRQQELHQSLTLNDLFPLFMQRYGIFQSKNMQSSYHNSFKNICRCKMLIEIPIKSVTKNIILDYMHLRMEKDGVKPASVNKESYFVQGMLSRATEWGYLEINPLQGLKRLRESEKRRVELTPEQAGELIDSLPEPIANIYEFAIYSGFRKENILSLRIEEIRLHDLTPSADVDLIVKGGRRETFPLGELAVRVLRKAMGDRTRGFVFINPRTGTRYASIHKGFNRVVRRLGLTVNGTKLRPHDLRHAFCTWLLREGVLIDAIRELAGHLDRRTTDQYATLNRMDMRKYLSLLPKIQKSIYRESKAI